VKIKIKDYITQAHQKEIENLMTHKSGPQFIIAVAHKPQTPTCARKFIISAQRKKRYFVLLFYSTFHNEFIPSQNTSFCWENY